MKYLLPLLLLLGCSPEQDFTVIPVEVTPPIEGPVVLEPGAVPPEVYAQDITEAWEQEEGATDLDVYVLVDRSCSMGAADFAKVSSALKQIIEDVELSMSTTGKWTVTLGTTSTTQVGPLPQFTRPAAADLPQTLLDISTAVNNLGGGRGEQGLYAAYDFQNTGLALDTTQNKLIITVSDEPDQSYLPDPTTHNIEGDYDADGDGVVDGWSNYWEPDEFSLWAAGEPSTDVIYIGPYGFSGRRWAKAASIHGRHIDFNSDWSGVLSTLTWVTALDDTFELSHDPIAGSLKVYFDGTRTWDWNLTGRTLRLVNPPPLGTVVEAKYSYWTF